MTTEDKLTYLKGNCASQAGCEGCRLSLEQTCNLKNWSEWTDEEIETAYAILFYHTPSYAEEQLEHAMKKKNEMEAKTTPPTKELEFVKVGDSVSHPLHYTQNGIECIEAIKASMTSDGFLDYCKGNVLKYIWRWRDKGGVEDLEKARVYLGWMIEEAKK